MEEVEQGSFVEEPSSCARLEFIRLVSWNVNRGLCLPELVEFLKASSADLILLQETDVSARRTGYLNIAREVASALKMNYVFGCEFVELSQGSCVSPALHGQTTLSRFPLSNPQIFRFKTQSTFWKPRWFIPQLPVFQRRLGSRIALICEISIKGRTIAIYNAHLESRGTDGLRYRQFSEMLGMAVSHSDKSHVIVAGDLNFNIAEGPASLLIATMQMATPFSRLEGKKTARVGGHAKSAAIDWILTDQKLRSSEAEIHDLISASDHYPLSLTLHI